MKILFLTLLTIATYVVLVYAGQRQDNSIAIARTDQSINPKPPQLTRPNDANYRAFLNRDRSNDPPNNLDIIGPPVIDPSCYTDPKKRPGAYYCNGNHPQPPFLTPDHLAFRSWLFSTHRDIAIDDEYGDPIPMGQFPVSIQREWIKHNNPGAVFEIDGISIAALAKLQDRHEDEVIYQPGFKAMGIDYQGIFIKTEPGTEGNFPSNFEGMPIRVIPITGHYETYGWSAVTASRPVRPAIEINWDPFVNSAAHGVGTLSGVINVNGVPWFIAPAHLLSSPQCSYNGPTGTTQSLPVYTGIALKDITDPYYALSNGIQNLELVQPVAGPLTVNWPFIGHARVWQGLAAGNTTFTNAGYDLLSGPLDNDGIRRNNSIATTGPNGFIVGSAYNKEFDGLLAINSPTAVSQMYGIMEPYSTSPPFVHPVHIFTADVQNTGIYVLNGSVLAVNIIGVTTGDPDCPATTYIRRTFEIAILASSGRNSRPGDSGAPVLSAETFPGGIVGYYEGYVYAGLIDTQHPENNGSSVLALSYGSASFALKLEDGLINLGPRIPINGEYTSLATSQGRDASPPILTAALQYPTQTVQLVNGFGGGCSWSLVQNPSLDTWARKVHVDKQGTPGNTNPGVTAWWQVYGTSTWNIPFDIAPNAQVQIALCMNATAPTSMAMYDTNFAGVNAFAPVMKPLYNTMSIGFTNVANASIFIAGATTTGDDVVHTGGPLGTGIVNTTIVNYGQIGDYITLTPDTIWPSQALPGVGTICEIDASSNCISPRTAYWSGYFAQNQVKTFGVYWQPNGGTIHLDLYNNNLFLKAHQGLNNPNGPIIGGTGWRLTTE